MRLYFWTAMTVLCLASACYAMEQYKKPGNDDRIMKFLLYGKNYSKDDPPKFDSPTKVQIGIYVIRFNSLNELTMEFSMTIYFRQTWKDPRLIYLKDDRVHDWIKLEENYWKDIWLPDTFFRNEKKANLHEVTVPNRYFTLNLTDGSVWYALRITTTLSCMMMLHKYPLDTQLCPVEMASFGYKRDMLNLTWLAKTPVDTENIDRQPVPQFFYEDFKLYDCSRNGSKAHSESCLKVLFRFRRDVGYFLIQVFVPSLLIVSLSWVSFWINVDAAPARVSLGLLTVLTTSSYSISINQNLARVSYIKAIDVWMSACLLFVFCALCEYAFVNVASRKKTIQRQPVSSGPVPSISAPAGSVPSGPLPTGSISTGPGPHGPGPITINPPILGPGPGPGTMPGPVSGSGRMIERTMNRIEEGCPLPAQQHPRPRLPFSALRPVVGAPGKAVDADGKARARRIDMVARRCFPLAFIVFNIIYWTAYSLAQVNSEKYP